MTTTCAVARITTVFTALAGVGVLALAGAVPAVAGPVAPASSDHVDVPAHLDWSTWTAADGAPRYRIDGVGFTEGHVRVIVANKAGRTLWTRTVATTHDDGVPTPTVHVGSTVRCDHRVRYLRAQDLGTGAWTQQYTLGPCIL